MWAAHHSKVRSFSKAAPPFAGLCSLAGPSSRVELVCQLDLPANLQQRGRELPGRRALGCSPSPSSFPWTISAIDQKVISHRLAFILVHRSIALSGYHRDIQAALLSQQRTFFFPLLLFEAARAFASLLT